METILRRQQHRDQQAMVLLREAVQAYVHNDDHQHHQQQQQQQQHPHPCRRSKRSASALQTHAIRTLAADPGWRARLTNIGSTGDSEAPSWAEVLAFLAAPAVPAAVRLSKWEAQSFAAFMRQTMEEEERAGLRACFDDGEVSLQLAMPRRRGRRGVASHHQHSQQPQQPQPQQQQQQQQQQQEEEEEEEEQQHHLQYPQQQTQQQQQQQQALARSFDLTALPGVVLAGVFAFASFRERGRCLQTAPAVRDAMVASTIFQNVVIPHHSRRAGPAVVAALLRLPMTRMQQGGEGKARRLVVGVGAGKFLVNEDGVVDVLNLPAEKAKETVALRELCDLFVNARAGTKLKTVILHDKPAWLTEVSLGLLLKHTPSLVTYKGPLFQEMRQIFDSGCLPHLQAVEFDLDASPREWNFGSQPTWLDFCAELPSLRHVVVVGRHGPYYTDYSPINNSTLTTVELYRMGSIDFYSPPAGTSPVLRHLRVQFHREARAGAEEGLFQWRYPLLRTLHLRLRQGYCGARYPAPLLPALCSGCRALEWVFLDLYPLIPDTGYFVAETDPVDPSPLLALPFLFYLLLRPQFWDLTRLPAGWVTQEITSENDGLMLEPVGVFSRPCGASTGLVACFKAAVSPVLYGHDTPQWSWRRPKFLTLDEMEGLDDGMEDRSTAL